MSYLGYVEDYNFESWSRKKRTNTVKVLSLETLKSMV